MLRLDAHADREGQITLHIQARPLPVDAFAWHAVTAPFPHEPPVGPRGIKGCDAPVLERARALRNPGQGADEVLLLDASGHLVEGAISNLVLVLAEGQAVTPAPTRCPVAGVALAVARARDIEIAEADVNEADLRSARELITLNAVRGARAIVSLDGRRVGDGEAGDFAQQLRTRLQSP